jgi:hypothetical protein
MKSFSEIPQGVSFLLKDEHSGFLCNAHFTQLSRAIKAMKARQEVEEDHVVHPISMEVVEESQEIFPALTTAAPRQEPKSPQKRGRKLKYNSDTRFRLAFAAVKGVSLSQTGEILGVMSSQDLDHLNATPSRTAVVQCLMELYCCYQAELALRLSQSSDIFLIMDSTTDHQREILVQCYGGKMGSIEWCWPKGLVEINGHSAVKQVEVVKSTLRDVNCLQRSQTAPETKLYHIRSLTADNTSSNTGENGVRGVLEKERQLLWKEDQQTGDCPALVFKGCEDHIENLVSREAEKKDGS